MKRLLTLVVIVLAAKISALAQPTITFPKASPCTEGSPSFCMDALVDDFTDILSMEFTIRWDPTVIRFDRIANTNLPGLSAANFDITNAVDSGFITLKWRFANCSPTAVGITLPDNRSIFRLCFTALGAYGASTEVAITNAPVDINVTRVNACDGINIGLFSNNGFVSTCVRPLELIASNEEANEGDLVCVDFMVRGFDNMTSAQFSVNWDPNVLKFEDIVVLNTLVNLSESGFGTPADPDIPPGVMTVSWAFVDPSDRRGITLADSTAIFQVCFRVVGPCESSSAVAFSSTPTPIEVTNTVREGFELKVLTESGGVQVGRCDPTGLKLIADCGPEVNLNDEVCVKVSTAGFQDILAADFLMKWNPNLLEFKELRRINTQSVVGLGANDFNISNVANGFLQLDWQTVANTPWSTPDGTVLFEVCFTVVGLGANSPFSFPATPSRVRTRTSGNIGINPSNCEVRIKQPQGVVLVMGDGEAPPGDTVCVAFNASNFDEIVSTQFSLAWDTSHVTFREIRDINLSGVSVSNFDIRSIDGGSLTFDWETLQPQTLPDNTRIFSVCFTVTGPPKSCQSVEIVDLPLKAEAVSATSNDNNIGLTGIGGEICVLNPEGFTLIIGKVEGFIGDTICVPFRVADFDGIIGTALTVNWDPTALGFVSVKPTGALNLTASNFRTTSANIGLLNFSYQNVNGGTIADSTVLFDLCLVMQGPKNVCHPISINPSATVTTLNGDGSVQGEPGEVCIKDRLVVENVRVKGVSCPGGRDGEIELTVSGGTGTIFYNWASVPTQFTNRARNLAVGQVAVTIFDSNNPPLLLRDTFEIPLTDQLPKAVAGPDRLAPCGTDNIFLLDGSRGSSTGNNYSFLWTTVGGELPGDPEAVSSVGRGPGVYILTVRDRTTLCATSDTVNILAPPVPVSNAGADLSFTCLQDTVQLDGSGSAQADSIGYRWRSFNGGAIIQGDANSLRPRITAPGTYVLETFFTRTNCGALDTVVVRDGRSFPSANAGQDVELNCADDFVLLDGSGSVNESGITYAWKNREGTVLATSISYQATQPGVYFLEAINSGNGCTRVDSVEVIASGDFPTVDVGQDLVLDCRADTLQVNATVTNNGQFTFQWVARGGGAIVAGTEQSLTPGISRPGVYELVVTNTTSQCVGSDSLFVTENRQLPTSEAGQAAQLSCKDNMLVLDGTGSSTGDSISYTWRLGSQTIGLDTLRVEITQAGTYILEVLNRDNGCTAIDSVQISQDANLPQIQLATIPALNCRETTVTLNANVTPVNPNYTIQWEGPSAGTIVGGGNTLNPQVNAAGTYKVTITNPENGCVGLGEAVVTSNVDPPLARAGQDRVLTCQDSTAVLDGSGSSNGANFTYQWSALAGGAAPEAATTAQARTRSVGSYVLLVTNTTNGCTARDTVAVTQDVSLPQVSIASPQLLSCTVKTVSLSGAGSSTGAGFTATWTGAAGQSVSTTNDPLVVNVGDPGTYRLTIRNNTNGCEASANVEVQADASLPTANAGGDQVLPCPGQPLTLNGSASSTGPNIVYQWTVVSGSGALTNPTSANASVTQAGTYRLEVRNSANGCSDTATVVVSVDPALVPADAGEDMSVCDDGGMLFAQLPTGITGQWTNSTGIKIETPGQPSTFVTGLANGDNVFTWTLSRANCPNYSSDQVIVRKEVAPNANNDLVTVPVGRRDVEINFVGNDQVNTGGEWQVTVTAQGTLGRVDAVSNGRARYIPRPGAFGNDELRYQLCNLSCPELCDSAFVQITVEFDENFKPQLPNAITPNGDGTNDELVFEVLENAIDFWPDNELIIFNRWGDIVYRAQPYANNWGGLNDSGQELPLGTYYYILRLDIANGVIYKGDITILK